MKKLTALSLFTTLALLGCITTQESTESSTVQDIQVKESQDTTKVKENDSETVLEVGNDVDSSKVIVSEETGFTLLNLRNQYTSLKTKHDEYHHDILEHKDRIKNRETGFDESEKKINELVLECDKIKTKIDSLTEEIHHEEHRDKEVKVLTKEIVATSNIVQDAIIRFGIGNTSGNWSSDNSGATTCIAVGTYDSRTIARTVLKWDISDLDSIENIQKVELILTPSSWVKENNSPDGLFRIYMSKMLESWNEGTVEDRGTCYSQSPNDSLINGVTGAERFYGERWGTYGIGLDDVDAEDYVSATAFTKVGTVEPFVFDVTNDVRYWLDGHENNGWVLTNPREFNVLNEMYPEIHSSESSNEALKPRLIVSYIEN